MADYIIQTGNYVCSYTTASSEGDKSVAVIAKIDKETGRVTVLSMIDEYGVGLVESMASEIQEYKKMLRDKANRGVAQVVSIPSVWNHYSGAKVADIYERAMNAAGVQWQSVDDVRKGY
ncbi:hypothetical protein ETAC_16535 [Edwardsiella piscicida C07-087]|uniref:hypothetical protein n=1 Tax=Edwardsiella piscicida TaxID=1263550 RepID=UPI0002C0B02F|nr:hypothetical protein [Edwardsiella piscicida]AGH75428.1 hypothetical protein ETAC_16535 [Edwardsiella piscicida C07-087]